jgi:hypothetical protein
VVVIEGLANGHRLQVEHLSLLRRTKLKARYIQQGYKPKRQGELKRVLPVVREEGPASRGYANIRDYISVVIEFGL